MGNMSQRRLRKRASRLAIASSKAMPRTRSTQEGTQQTFYGFTKLPAELRMEIFRSYGVGLLKNKKGFVVPSSETPLINALRGCSKVQDIYQEALGAFYSNALFKVCLADIASNSQTVNIWKRIEHVHIIIDDFPYKKQSDERFAKDFMSGNFRQAILSGESQMRSFQLFVDQYEQSRPTGSMRVLKDAAFLNKYTKILKMVTDELCACCIYMSRLESVFVAVQINSPRIVQIPIASTPGIIQTYFETITAPWISRHQTYIKSTESDHLALQDNWDQFYRCRYRWRCGVSLRPFDTW